MRVQFNYGLQKSIFLPGLEFGAIHGVFHASRIIAAVNLHTRFEALTFQVCSMRSQELNLSASACVWG